MTKDEELSFLNAILDFQVPIIPETTRFWMVRTQRGYFYNEFVTRVLLHLLGTILTQKPIFLNHQRNL